MCHKKTYTGMIGTLKYKLGLFAEKLISRLSPIMLEDKIIA